MSSDAYSLFEAKTHFSHLVQEVAESHREVVVTVRGLPKVRIVPYDTTATEDVWVVRERLATEYGEFDLQLPARLAEVPRNPLAE